MSECFSYESSHKNSFIIPGLKKYYCCLQSVFLSTNDDLFLTSASVREVCSVMGYMQHWQGRVSEVQVAPPMNLFLFKSNSGPCQPVDHKRLLFNSWHCYCWCLGVVKQIIKISTHDLTGYAPGQDWCRGGIGRPTLGCQVYNTMFLLSLLCRSNYALCGAG